MSEPGAVLQVDHRPKVSKSPTNLPLLESIKVLQWNIERGYNLDLVIERLKFESPDILSLQELDIGCERSGMRNCLDEIAMALGMQGVFVLEFWELPHKCRSRGNSVGSEPGMHGNAIFTRFDWGDIKVIKHEFQPVNWCQEGLAYGEPRDGLRCSLAADIITPLGEMKVYSVHLEVFCGIVGRLAQFSEIFEHAHSTVDRQPFQVILGDLNTMAHGIARLSSSYCNDPFRWLSIGKTEAQWWDENIFSFTTEDGPTHVLLSSMFLEFIMPKMNPIPIFNRLIEDYQSTAVSPLSPLNSHALGADVYISTPHPLNYQQLLDSFFVNIRNPGFYDPFPVETPTLHNYWGLFKGKLDWFLARNMILTNQKMGNQDYKASDHCYLVANITFDNTGITSSRIINEKRMKRLKRAMNERKQCSSWCTALTISVLALVSLSVLKWTNWKRLLSK